MTEAKCPTCGCAHSFPDALYVAAKHSAHIWIHCPYGHRWHYPEKEVLTMVEKMRRERDRAIQDAAYHADCARLAREYEERATRSAAAYKGAATRLKNRAKAGLCPCCNRTFQNLRRHMATQHPDHELDNVVELGQMGAQ